MERDSRRHTKCIRKKISHITKCKMFPNKGLITSKWVQRSMELFLATSKEIRAALGREQVKDNEIIAIRCRGEILMNIYNLKYF